MAASDAKAEAAAAAKAKAEAFAVRLAANPAAAVEEATKSAFDAFLRVAVDRYHNTDAPLVTDALYDAALLAYRRRFPKSDVPLVAAPPEGQKTALPVWMGSLSKIVDDPAALERWRKAHPGPHALSDKLDGISGLLEVREAGGGARLMTRGDGAFGRDVSHLMPLMKHFPLPPAPAPGAGPLLVRGELILPRADFAELKRGASARNLANGVINATRNPDAEVAARLRFVTYELIPASREAPSLAPSAQFAAMRAWGLPVVEAWAVPAEALTQEALAEALVRRQAESPFEVDGVVVAADAAHTRETGKNPTHAFAFKTMAALTEEATTIVEVVWEVSKDEKLKPTLVFAPVTIDGKRIERATGNNARFVEAHRLAPGVRVRVVLAGAVIPRVLPVPVPAAAEGEGPPAAMPTVPWKWDAAHVDAVLDPAARSTKNRRAVGVRKMLHLVETLQVKGVGESLVERLYDAGIATPEALATTTTAALARVEGIKQTRATAISAAIGDAIKRADCMTVAVASNAFGAGIGRTKLSAVFQAHPDFAQVLPTEDQLREVKGVGEATAKAILSHAPAFAEFLRANPALAARCAPGAPKAAAGPVPPPSLDLTGRVFVFTGFMSASLKAYIERAGGRVAESVSGATTAVIVKDPSKPESGKVKDARRLGVRVVPLADVMDARTDTIVSASLTP